jgi:hypothetical protein
MEFCFLSGGTTSVKSVKLKEVVKPDRPCSHGSYRCEPWRTNHIILSVATIHHSIFPVYLFSLLCVETDAGGVETYAAIGAETDV